MMGGEKKTIKKHRKKEEGEKKRGVVLRATWLNKKVYYTKKRYINQFSPEATAV